MNLNQLDPFSEVDVTFHRKAEVFTSWLIFQEAFDPTYCEQYLSGVKSALVERGALAEKSDFYCAGTRTAIANYKRFLAEQMYAADGLFHDEQRIETFRAAIEDMFDFYRSDARFEKWAPLLIPMQSLQCGLSLRPSEGLVTNLKGLEACDVIDTSFDSGLEDFNRFEDGKGPQRSTHRRAFLAQHMVVIYGHGEADAEYVSVCDLQAHRTSKPILGIQARGRVKNDPKGNRGQRSIGSNPDPSDSFCLVRPVVELLRRYPPRRGSTIWSGLPGGELGEGRKYYRLLSLAMSAWAVERGIDHRRLNLHCNRLYGSQQLARQSEETRGDQGGWTLRAEQAGAKGAQVYYRLHFWNHAMKVRDDMHAKFIPLAHLDRHRQGIAQSLSRQDKRARRHEILGKLLRPLPFDPESGGH